MGIYTSTLMVTGSAHISGSLDVDGLVDQVFGDLTVGNDLYVSGDISVSGSVDMPNLTLTGDIQVGGKDIKDEGGAIAIHLSGSGEAKIMGDAYAASDLFVSGNLKIGTGSLCNGILDEDNMSTNSAIALATQQSIKAYVDASTPDTLSEIGNVNTADVTKAAGHVLVWDNNQSRWENAAITGTSNEIDVTLGEGSISLSFPTNVTVAGDLHVDGGDIYGPTDANLRIRSDANVIVQLDQDNDGTNKFVVWNNSETSKFEVDESGNVQMDGSVTIGSNTIKASDGGTAITLDTSDNVTIGNNLILGNNRIYNVDNELVITVDADQNASIQGDLTVVGNHIKNTSGDLTIDSAADIILDAAGANITFKDDGTTPLDFKQDNSGDWTVQNLTSQKSLIFKTNQNGSNIDAMRIDCTNSTSDVIFNEGSEREFDFRIESGEDTHMFYVDGYFDRIGLGFDSSIWANNRPASRVHIEHTETTVAGADNQLQDFTLFLKNLSTTVNSFAGIAFDVSSEADEDSIGAAIRVERDTSASTNPANHDANLTFATNDAGDDGLTERMRITHDGLVGIGTATPGHSLDVTGNARITGDLTIEGTTTTVNTTNLLVKDKNIVINDGGGAASGAGAGLDIEENGSITGYIRVADDDRGNWDLKAPDGSELKIDVNANKTLTVAGSLNIEADSNINQDVTTDASPQFTALTVGTNITVGDGHFKAAAGQTLELDSPHHVIVNLDTDNNGTAEFLIKNGADATILDLDESGNLQFDGTLQIGSSTTVAGVLDEDAMDSNSATSLATQQSIKAYVDGAVIPARTAGSGLDLSGNALAVDVSDFLTNGANNRIITATSADAMNAESSLTFDGTDLSVSGKVKTIGLEFTDGDDAINISDGGYVEIVKGLNKSNSVLVGEPGYDSGSDDQWIKVASIANAFNSITYGTNQTTFLIHQTYLGDTARAATETYIAYVRLSGDSSGNANTSDCDVTVELLSSHDDIGAWSPSNVTLSFDATADAASLWVQSTNIGAKCWVSILGGTNPEGYALNNIGANSEGWAIQTGQSWAASITSNGTDVTGIWADKTFNALHVQGGAMIGDAAANRGYGHVELEMNASDDAAEGITISAPGGARTLRFLDMSSNRSIFAGSGGDANIVIGANGLYLETRPYVNYGSAADFVLRRQDSTLVSGNQLGRMIFQGAESSTYYGVGAVECVADESWVNNSTHATRVQIYATPAGSTVNDKAAVFRATTDATCLQLDGNITEDAFFSDGHQYKVDGVEAPSIEKGDCLVLTDGKLKKSSAPKQKNVAGIAWYRLCDHKSEDIGGNGFNRVFGIQPQPEVIFDSESEHIGKYQVPHTNGPIYDSIEDWEAAEDPYSKEFSKKWRDSLGNLYDQAARDENDNWDIHSEYAKVWKVISLGDSRQHESPDESVNYATDIQGFKVCNEGGTIETGDLLCTSSTPGHLMKQDDDLMHSYTVAKAMQDVTFDSEGEASGIYGYIYCG